MTTTPRLAIATIAALVTLSPAVARAQTVSRNPVAAQALFEEGRKLMNAGKLAEACPKLAESQRLDPGAGTLINLAACYEKNGQTASAWATYKEAIPESEKSNRAEWATRARQHAAALEPMLARLTIVLPPESRAAGLVIKRDGVDVGSGELGVAIPVDPGTHLVEVNAPGKKKWTQNTTATAKNTATVNVPTLETKEHDPVAAGHDTPATTTVATPAPTAPAASRPNAEGGGSGQRIVGLIVGGVGVAGLAVGAIFGLTAVSHRSAARDNCSPDFTTCDQTGLNSIDDAKSAATLSTIGFVAGGVLLAGGIVLVLTAPRKGDSGVALRVAPTTAGATLSIGGGFR